jgi:hypothetical protein
MEAFHGQRQRYDSFVTHLAHPFFSPMCDDSQLLEKDKPSAVRFRFV